MNIPTAPMLGRCAKPNIMSIDSSLEAKLQQIVSRIFAGDLSVATDIENLSPYEANQLDMIYAMQFLFSESANYRGRVIDITIFLEMALSIMLSKYFSEKNQKKESLLNAYIFDRMPLSQKLNLLKNILKDAHPEISSKYSKDLSEISRLIEFRNNIAHSMLNSSQEYLGKISEKLKKVRTQNSQTINHDEFLEIEITYYQNGKAVNRRITRNDIDNHHTSCIEKVNWLQQLNKDL